MSEKGTFGVQSSQAPSHKDIPRDLLEQQMRREEIEHERAHGVVVAPTPLRLLTTEEAKDVMEWTLLQSEVDAIQRKFCEVNGLPQPTAADGVATPLKGDA